MAPYTTSTISADGVNIFYRSSGPPTAPVILLLHGFPSSSHQFRNLIPLLSQNHRVIAPDLPGYGFTDVPPSRAYQYTFASLASTTGAFLDALSIRQFSLYIFDYGAPLGRASPHHAERKRLPSPDREQLRRLLTLEATRSQYTSGTPDAKRAAIAPEAYTLDHHLMSSAARQEAQLDLLQDYGSNVLLYPRFHEWFRASRVPILAAWGRNDSIFLPAGAAAFREDLGEQVELHLLDAGHFAVETETEELAGLILAFLGKNGI
ncbi:Alpha/Beta hydrolase protein [Amylocarpus encephaloides]|uniref:Alpha/Beta hydrolase protein n=1 Tax=Amylocarpus encephaloides TaxID=45428 RepID=A0A9P8C3E4_9HELO|nr:Alpha/Beta hydrolase protein [Amylocarpus encephaloides]